MVTHDYAQWKMPVSRFGRLADLLSTEDFTDGIYATKLSADNTFDFLIKKAPTDLGIVVFNAAISRKKTPHPPFFSGQGVALAANATLIAVSDLALTYDDTLEIGWHAGGHSVNMQNILPRVLTHLRNCLGINRMVLFGGSAGGFASLYCGSIMKDVLPIAANLQTTISNYYPQPVKAYARTCWNWDETTEIGAFLDSKIAQRLAPLYVAKPKPFLYVQNINDDHVKRHALPFMEELEGVPMQAVTGPVGSGFMDFREWGDGHVAPPRLEIAEIIKNALEWQGTWTSYIKSLSK